MNIAVAFAMINEEQKGLKLISFLESVLLNSQQLFDNQRTSSMVYTTKHSIKSNITSKQCVYQCLLKSVMHFNLAVLQLRTLKHNSLLNQQYGQLEENYLDMKEQ